MLLTGKGVKVRILTGISRELRCISMKFTSNARRKAKETTKKFRYSQ